MKYINVVLGKANPDRQNGVNVVVHNLAKAQRTAGIDAEVWGFTRTPQGATSVRPYPLRLFNNWSPIIDFDSRLGAALDGLTSTDIVHLHGALVPQFYFLSCSLRIRRIQWVITPHGALNRRSLAKRDILKRVYIALFESALLRDSLSVHVYSEDEIEPVSEYVEPAKRIVLPNGCAFPDNIQHVSPPVGRSPVFGYIGRLAVAQKGLDLLISGFAEYKHSGGSGSLEIVGDGQSLQYLKNLATQLAVGSSVRFVGPRYGVEKDVALSRFDVFVHTSRWEGMPLAVLEAAAVGKPLLVSRETNLAAYVQKWSAGYVLPNLTASAIAEALMKAEGEHRSSTLLVKSNAAAEMARQEFDWSCIAKKLAVHISKMRDMACI